MDDVRVRQLVAAYLDGKLALRDLHSEIVTISWNEDAPARARQLADTVALRLDEFTSGTCSAEELGDALRPVIAEYAVALGNARGTRQLTGSSLSVVTSAASLMRPTLVDTRFEVVAS